MTIVQLEYLLAVVNFGSFSLAAERSFVTQPSLSMQIKNLEEELGVVLLDRSKKTGHIDAGWRGGRRTGPGCREDVQFGL